MKKMKKIKKRAIELYHKDSPFKPKIVQDKRVRDLEKRLKKETKDV